MSIHQNAKRSTFLREPFRVSEQNPSLGTVSIPRNRRLKKESRDVRLETPAHFPPFGIVKSCIFIIFLKNLLNLHIKRGGWG